MTSRGTAGGFLLCFICIILISVSNIIQKLDIMELEKLVYNQGGQIEQVVEFQNDMRDDIDEINDILTGGLELGTFTATYYCA